MHCNGPSRIDHDNPAMLGMEIESNVYFTILVKELISGTQISREYSAPSTIQCMVNADRTKEETT